MVQSDLQGLLPGRSSGDLSTVLSIGCVVTRESPTSHLESIPLFSDPPLNADVDATGGNRRREKKEKL
jgi:hypothetical protein